MSKTLFILISDGGDGSQGLHYSFDAELVARMEDDHNFDVIGENYMSGDGLQVNKLQVPIDYSMEDLGVSKWSVLDRSNYAEFFEDDE